jgi:DNA-binding beta-propeller fold protein YncE
MSRHVSRFSTATIAACALAALILGPGSGCASSDAKPKSTAITAPVGSYAFWPMAPDEPRIQFVRSFQSSNDLEAVKTSGLEQAVFGKEVEAAAEVNKPYGVAMRGGKIYVCDMRSSSLVIFDIPKKQTRLVGTSGVNKLDHPVAVAVAEDGFIYVADNQRGAIVVFDPSERYAQTFGIPKFKPVSLAIYGDRLYCTDMASQSIQIFNRRTGDRIGSFGSVGDEDGQFRLPLGVACDPKGNVWVVDMMRCRVQKFSPEGKFIGGMGMLGDIAGSFARPKHIAIDADGVVYVVDSAFQNVQMFDDQMRLLMSFGAAGAFPGAMNLPAGIAVCEGNTELVADQIHPGFAAKRLVLVTNQFGADKVSVYAMGQRREGYTVQALSAASVQVSTGTDVNPEHVKMQDVGNQEPNQPAPGQAEPKASDTPAPPASPAAPAPGGK